MYVWFHILTAWNKTSVCLCVCMEVWENLLLSGHWTMSYSGKKRERNERKEKNGRRREARHITWCNAPINCRAVCSNNLAHAGGAVGGSKGSSQSNCHVTQTFSSTAIFRGVYDLPPKRPPAVCSCNANPQQCSLLPIELFMLTEPVHRYIIGTAAGTVSVTTS